MDHTMPKAPFYSLAPPGVSVTMATAVGSMVSMEFKGRTHLIKTQQGLEDYEASTHNDGGSPSLAQPPANQGSIRR